MGLKSKALSELNLSEALQMTAHVKQNIAYLFKTTPTWSVKGMLQITLNEVF